MSHGCHLDILLPPISTSFFKVLPGAGIGPCPGQRAKRQLDPLWPGAALPPGPSRGPKADPLDISQEHNPKAKQNLPAVYVPLSKGNTPEHAATAWQLASQPVLDNTYPKG